MYFCAKKCRRLPYVSQSLFPSFAYPSLLQCIIIGCQTNLSLPPSSCCHQILLQQKGRRKRVQKQVLLSLTEAKGGRGSHICSWHFREYLPPFLLMFENKATGKGQNIFQVLVFFTILKRSKIIYYHFSVQFVYGWVRCIGPPSFLPPPPDKWEELIMGQKKKQAAPVSSSVSAEVWWIYFPVRRLGSVQDW